MNKVIQWALIILLQAKSQVYIDENLDGLAKVDENTKITFPKDHGAHPKFRTEWWYITANLKDSNGKLFGVQWTLFRTALSPKDSMKVGGITKYGWVMLHLPLPDFISFLRNLPVVVSGKLV